MRRRELRLAWGAHIRRSTAPALLGRPAKPSQCFRNRNTLCEAFTAARQNGHSTVDVSLDGPQTDTQELGESPWSHLGGKIRRQHRDCHRQSIQFGSAILIVPDIGARPIRIQIYEPMMCSVATYRNRRGLRPSPGGSAPQCSVHSVPFRSHFLPQYLSSGVSSCRLMSVYHIDFKCIIGNLNEDSIALNRSSKPRVGSSSLSGRAKTPPVRPLLRAAPRP